MPEKPAQYGEPLTTTEEMLTTLVLKGMGPVDIGRATGRSTNAVKTALGRVYVKFGVQGSNELFAEAYRQQAILLWTGQRVYYPESRPKLPREGWSTSLADKPTALEQRLVSTLVQQPDARTHDLSRALSVPPGEVHAGLLSLYRKAGVTGRSGLLEMVL